MNNETNNYEFIVTFSDFKNIYKKNRGFILKGALLFGFIAVLYTLMSPPQYPVKATFREQSRAKSGIDNDFSLGNMLTGNTSSIQNQVVTLMQSHNLLDKLVKIHNLQGIITPKSKIALSIDTIKDNLNIEYSILRRRDKPNIKGPYNDITISNISYNGEIPLHLQLKPLNDKTFELYDHLETLIGKGEFDTEFKTENYQFTLKRNSGKPLYDTAYRLDIFPAEAVAAKLSKKIGITPHSKDKTLLELSYSNPDRFLAANVLNTLMTLYQDYLREEYRRITNEQLSYLKIRKEQEHELLKEMLTRYAKEQSAGVSSAGFATTDSAMEFLAASQQQHRGKVMAIDLEIKRLEQMQQDGYAHYDRYGTEGDPVIINQLLAEIRNLKLQADATELAIKENSRMPSKMTQQTEFNGITLALAKDLYLNYCKELNTAESQVVQYQFIRDNLQDNDFEVSSLNSILNDSISSQIIANYSQLLLQLKDEANRSLKEQERLKSELQLRRGFLDMHLSQVSQLFNLKTDLIKDKIFSLQNISISLIHKQIAILEKQLRDYTHARIQNLMQERDVINQHIQKINVDMAKLPEKRIYEKLMTQELETSQKAQREIASMVESKSIAKNLEVIQSTPIDSAQVPIFPKSPLTLLFFLAGAVGGGFLMSCTLLFKEASSGITATAENLKEIHQHLSGALSKECEKTPNRQDINTLRHLMNHLVDESKIILLIEGNGPDYSKQLAILAHKKGLKTLIIPLTFQEGQDDRNGLFDYLEGNSKLPEKYSGGSFDYLKVGHASEYTNELITSKRFHELLATFESEYDLVLLVSNNSANSPEAEAQLNISKRVALTLKGEKLEQLTKYFDKSKGNPDNRVTFIFY